MPAVDVSAEIIQKQIEELTKASDEIERTRKTIMSQYQQLGYQWKDNKYKTLGDIVNATNDSLRNIEIIFLKGQRKLCQMLSAVTEYEDVNLSSLNQSETVNGGFSRHLSLDEVDARWRSGVISIEEQIANYKDGLLARGVPECGWLNDYLARSRAAMLRQEGYDLDIASGRANDTTHNSDEYQYPGDYSAFYDEVAVQFRQYCLDGTNPNYQDAPEWRDNCQRCVPACELRRRGEEVTAQPSTYGSSHLSYRPFDVWEGADVRNGTGNGVSTIRESMAGWGDGSRAQVVVFWDGPLGGGHTFMAEQRNGTTVFFDPQTGNADCSNYFNRVLDGRTQYCRIDNLQFSSFVEDCYREVV